MGRQDASRLVSGLEFLFAGMVQVPSGCLSDRARRVAKRITAAPYGLDIVFSAGRLGFAVQLSLLRHPGMGLAQMEEPVEALVEWLAAQLDIPAAAPTGGRP